MELITTLKTLIATISAIILTVLGLSTPTVTPEMPPGEPIIEIATTTAQIASSTPETTEIAPKTQYQKDLENAYELGKVIGHIEAKLEVIEKVVASTTSPQSEMPVIPVETVPLPTSPAPESTSQPLPEPIIQPKQMSSLEIISPINGKGLNRKYVAKPGIGEKGVSYDESNEIILGLVVKNDAGDVVNNVTVAVESTDTTQNATLNGTGNVGKIYVDGNEKQVYYYPYTYQFKTSGKHTITFSALGLTQSVELDVLEQSPEN